MDTTETTTTETTTPTTPANGPKTIRPTLVLTPEIERQLAVIRRHRQDRTIPEIMQQIFERGCYDLSYRSVRNAKQYAEFKAWKASQK